MRAGSVGFVLGGGGVLGAVEVGMLRALFRADIRPDVLVGTSIGAINAAMVAGNPDPSVIHDLVRLWASPELNEVYGDSVPRQMRRFATRTHLHPPAPLRRILERHLGPDLSFEELKVPLHLVGASIERAAEHWFTAGPVVPAVMASAAVPGLLPPVAIGEEHFIDGSVVNPTPVARAVSLGAQEVFVLQVGRIEKPLKPPQRPWEAATVAMELARRARFAEELARAPAGVRVHVLPGGAEADESPWAYRDTAGVRHRVSAAYAASRDYLAQRAGFNAS
ncbi:patatin-like phospholipase family protein [Allorhizocola rhizosphaerae]|uniref:patatin-like phospholipase family protein n=1 Tax=Allorhizocola rhizosphaerae TaxID=1872709 RepID=UPI000E3CFDD0